MKISSVMGRMTLRERKMLHESVKQRISEGSESIKTVWSPNTKTADVPNDSTLSKDDKVIFKKTQEGWKTTLRISEDQILDLVNDSVQDEIKKQMRAARGQGDEIHIAKTSLKDPGVANKPDELLLQRDGDVFADPVPVKDAYAIAQDLGLVFSSGSQQQTGVDNNKHFFGNAFIVLSGDKATLSVPADDLSGFDDLFGTSSTGKIAVAIQKAKGGRNPSTFKIPLSYALDDSIMKFMSDSVLRNLGIGKITFEKSGDNYEATVSGNMDALQKKLKDRKSNG